MYEAERIAVDPCGCHVDKVLGIVTEFCSLHEAEAQKWQEQFYGRKRRKSPAGQGGKT